MKRVSLAVLLFPMLLVVSSAIAGEEDLEVDTLIQFVPQHCTHWCWAAAIEMVSQDYGLMASQCEIVSERSKTDCCSPQACKTACNQGSGSADNFSESLEKRDIKAVYKSRALGEGELRSILNNGSPVIAATNPHAFLITGFKRIKGEYTYKVLDPFLGERHLPYRLVAVYEEHPWSYSWHDFY